ncbi:MAG: hypothetical protein HKN79_11265, partial [Flavobacteriales bacterium]|nr:hypothetical protein [Flavobacteriales bacterium]
VMGLLSGMAISGNPSGKSRWYGVGAVLCGELHASVIPTTTNDQSVLLDRVIKRLL